MRYTKSPLFYNFNHVQAEQISSIKVNNNNDIFIDVYEHETPFWLKKWVRSMENQNQLHFNDEDYTLIYTHNDDTKVIIETYDYIVSIKQTDGNYLVVPISRTIFETLFRSNAELKHMNDNNDDFEDNDEDYSDNENEDNDDSLDTSEIAKKLSDILQYTREDWKKELADFRDKFDDPNLFKLADTCETRRELADKIGYDSSTISHWFLKSKHQGELFN